MRQLTVALILSSIAFCSCENDGGAPNADGDSTTRFERGVARVGEKLETAAADVGAEVRESRIQMVIDQIKGMDSVQAEIMEDGSVVLIGSVASAEIAANAIKLVNSIEGVENVRSSVIVGSNPVADSSGVETGVDTATGGGPK